MRRIWSYGLVLVLTGCNTTGGAAGVSFNYKDILKPRGHERGQAALDADLIFCDQRLDVQTGRVIARYNKCMLGRGWRFTGTVPAPSSPGYSASSDPTPSYDYGSPPPPPPPPEPPPVVYDPTLDRNNAASPWFQFGY